MKGFVVVNPEVLIARRAERVGIRPPLWGVRRGDIAFLVALRTVEERREVSRSAWVSVATARNQYGASTVSPAPFNMAVNARMEVR